MSQCSATNFAKFSRVLSVFCVVSCRPICRSGRGFVLRRGKAPSTGISVYCSMDFLTMSSWRLEPTSFKTTPPIFKSFSKFAIPASTAADVRVILVTFREITMGALNMRASSELEHVPLTSCPSNRPRLPSIMARSCPEKLCTKRDCKLLASKKNGSRLVQGCFAAWCNQRASI